MTRTATNEGATSGLRVDAVSPRTVQTQQLKDGGKSYARDATPMDCGARHFCNWARSESHCRNAGQAGGPHTCGYGQAEQRRSTMTPNRSQNRVGGSCPRLPFRRSEPVGSGRVRDERPNRTTPRPCTLAAGLAPSSSLSARPMFPTDSDRPSLSGSAPTAQPPLSGH
jgi:hypothetical protein